MLSLSVLITVFVTNFNVSIISNDLFKETSDFSINQGEDPTFVTCQLLENHSIAWMSAYLTLNISTDVAIYINYLVYGVGFNQLKVVYSSSTNQQIPAGSNLVTIPIQTTIDAFPGIYNYAMFVYFVNDSSGSPVNQMIFQVIPGTINISMGITWSIALLGVLGIGLLFILIRTEKVRHEQPNTEGTAQVYNSGTQITEVKTPGNSDRTRPGFIRCPECKKEIKEGSSFCPECGYHIPKFLRNRVAN
jgi:hypothetical protein